MAFYFTQAEMKEDLVRNGGSWGEVWGNFPPKCLWRPVDWRPYDKNAPQRDEKYPKQCNA